MTKTKKATICAFFAAIISLTAPFSIVIGAVPITLTLFSLGLTAFVAGSKKGLTATLVYILLGTAGIPVFANFRSGLSAFMSPTGGFIFSYIFVVVILGLCAKAKSKVAIGIIWSLALLVCYTFGTVWYMIFADASFFTAITLCILPFIPFDVIKLVLAYIIAKKVKKTLGKAGLMDE